MALSSHFPLLKTLHSSKQFPFLVSLLPNGVAWGRSTETNERISGGTVLLLIEKMNQITPKTIGNRKRDGSVKLTPPEKSADRKAQIRKAFFRFRSQDRFVIFDLKIFSSGVLFPEQNLTHNLFSISNSFWY